MNCLIKRSIIVETPIPKANNLKVTIGIEELVSLTIPRSGGFNTPQLAAESVSKACFGVHTRDSGAIKALLLKNNHL